MSHPVREPEPLTGGRLLGAGVLLGLANFLVLLDTSIANVSVPHIAGSLAVSPSQGTWVITSYSVAEAITVPLTGWLVKRFGSVKVFVAAILGFGLFSMLCGTAISFAMLITFRVLQGLAGGPIMATSQTLLLHIFPKDKAPQALGLWVMTTVTAPIAGPLLGGQISDSIGWNWIFLINVPVALGVALGGWFMLRDHETPSRRAPVDYVGLLLLAVWVGALQIMLDRGKELDWFASGFIVTLSIVAAIGFLAFLIWELTAEDPVVDLKIFRHRGFTVGVAAMSLNFGIFFGSVVLIPLWLQTSLGYTATWAGNASAMNGVLAVVMAPIAATLMRFVDPRLMVSAGVLGVASIAFWRAHFTTSLGFWDVGLPFLVQGAAMPFYFMPVNLLVISAVKPEETASAAGIANFLRTTSAAFATSIMTTAWENTTTVRRGELVGRMNHVQGTLDSLAARGMAPGQALAQLDGLMQQQATVLATNHLFLISSVLLLFAASIIWLSPRAKLGQAPPGGH